MSRLLKLFATIFSALTLISSAESLAATANMCVGNESLLAIRPCLSKLTCSEWCVVLSCCMVTISANVIGLYVGALRDVFPPIAGHLVSATILSIPAVVLLAKLAVPETETPETFGLRVDSHYERENSFVEAIFTGGENGFKKIVGITTMLIVVVGLLAISNLLVGWCGQQMNPHIGLTGNWFCTSLSSWCVEVESRRTSFVWTDNEEQGGIVGVNLSILSTDWLSCSRPSLLRESCYNIAL